MRAPTGSAAAFVRDEWGVFCTPDGTAADGSGANGASLITAAMPDRPRREAGKMWLPGGPWRARTSRGTTGRAAMALYAAGTLLDVVVATALADEVLRGARRAVWNGRAQAIAWGRLTEPDAHGPGHSDVAVFFARGRRGRRWNRDRRQDVCVADVVGLADCFWVAIADGSFSTVTVIRRGKQATRKLATVHPRL
ncbi:MAG TPA: hypothetical protein VMF87_27630 [Streptosporangiaceae bacterium]|nr:hypothetical protein [Streptosporangiaceae bacterium]